MAQVALKTDAFGDTRDVVPSLSGETRRQLGNALRALYEDTLDTQPIPDDQVDLLLRLRHRERELRRAS